MRETVADQSKVERSTTAVRRGFLSSLVPYIEDRISPEFYRLSGKLRALANLAFLIANFAMAGRVEELGFDPDVHARFFGVICTVHVIDGTLGLAIWRGPLSPRMMRQLTLACAMFEGLGVVAAAWVYGSVNSPFIGIELVFISMYRLAFDRLVGLAAFITILGGQWALVGCELAHVLPPQPMSPGGAIDAVYGNAARELGAMVNLTVAFALTFVVAHWAVARMRHKDVAIRLLRESLYSSTERGKFGRHTGRTLRDTYALGSLLGSGGMGEVYLGTHLRTHRKIAIKLLHTHLVEDQQVLSRFRREAEITGRLGSENIIQVIDVDEDDGQPFLVLELLEGESLAARVKAKGSLPLAEIAEIIDPVTSALELAHGAGVIHRDLKPENVFLCKRAGGGAIVKLLDFGVSKIRGTATLTKDIGVLGTPDYMPPEQAASEAESVDATADMFSLGGVIYTMLTGQRPFVADSIPALLRKICDEEPVPITEYAPQVPRAVIDVVAIAMAKRPTERYARAGELARDLRAAIAGDGDAIAARASELTRGTVARQSRPVIAQVTAAADPP